MISVADVQEWDSTITEARAQAWIDALTAQINDYVGRPVLSTTYTDELVNGTGTRLLPLRSWPITNVASVYIDDTEVDSDEYEVKGYLAEFLYRKNSNWPWQPEGWSSLSSEPFGDGKFNMKVTYTAGLAEVPADLKLAMAREIVRMNCKSPMEPGQIVEERTPGGMMRKWAKSDSSMFSEYSPFGPELTRVLNSSRFKRPDV